MHRQEYHIDVSANPSIATFIKHMCKMHLVIPRLNLGVVMINTTTAINEEWLTSIESLPTHKIFYDYIYDILSMQCNFCIHLKKTQKENDTYISLADIDYYIIKPEEVIKLDPIKELKETLLHSFSEYRAINTKTIELAAFSSGTKIDDELVNRLSFLDTELFNREYKNIKIIHSQNYETYFPFSIIAPEGNIRIFMEKYTWFNSSTYFKSMLTYLKEVISDQISEFDIAKVDMKKDVPTTSAYDPKSNIVFANDIMTMCIVNFFGCECQLGTYHKFNISSVNMKTFHKAVNKTISEICKTIN
nr:CPPV272 RNA polymerase subunit 35 [Cooks petrelpox virus]